MSSNVPSLKKKSEILVCALEQMLIERVLQEKQSIRQDNVDETLIIALWQ